VEGLSNRTVTNMMAFMEKLRRMQEDDPLAFEVCVRHIAAVIEGRRRDSSYVSPAGARPGGHRA
jgi:hypothetical protein